MKQSVLRTTGISDGRQHKSFYEPAHTQKYKSVEDGVLVFAAYGQPHIPHPQAVAHQASHMPDVDDMRAMNLDEIGFRQITPENGDVE